MLDRNLVPRLAASRMRDPGIALQEFLLAVLNLVQQLEDEKC
ncbi:hypothetical protein CSC32_6447 [Pseudomonas aeruginosa]|nr:hypothetical protein CSC32_6447 [Pseudomonas aeruginosa]